MTERSVWKIQELREDGKWYRMFGRYYDTKAEAITALPLAVVLSAGIWAILWWLA